MYFISINISYLFLRWWRPEGLLIKMVSLLTRVFFFVFFWTSKFLVRYELGFFINFCFYIGDLILNFLVCFYFHFFIKIYSILYIIFHYFQILSYYPKKDKCYVPTYLALLQLFEEKWTCSYKNQIKQWYSTYRKYKQIKKRWTKH